MPRAGSSPSPAEAGRRDGLDVPLVPVGGPGRDRGPRTVPLLIALAIVGLGLAIAKPWDDGRPDLADPTTAPAVAASAAAPSSGPAPTPLDLTDPWTAAGMVAALGDRDAWGVSALSGGLPSGSRIPAFVEAWRRAVPTAGGPVAPLILTTPGPVRALAITAPRDDVPLDVRAWARRTDGGWGWLLVGRASTDRPGAAPILLPPAGLAGPLERWPAGRYRLDLLMGDRVQRIDITLDPLDGPSSGEPAPEELVALAGWPVVEGPAAAVSWLDLDGTGSADGRPGPPMLLMAARSFAAFAGTPGFAVAVDGAESRWYRGSTPVGCGDERIDGTVRVIGVTHPPGVPPTSIAIQTDGPLARRSSFPVLTTREVVPGLTLVAPARGSGFPGGVHRLILGRPEGHDDIRVCFGTDVDPG